MDALYLSGRLPDGAGLPAGLFDRLTSAKESAADSGAPSQVSLGGHLFRVLGHGQGNYAMVLRHEHGLLKVTDSERLPAFRVEPLAEFLHSADPAAAAAWFSSVVEAELGPGVVWSPSRVDLFVDLQGVTFGADDRDRLVCRPRHLEQFFEDGELTGIEIGRRRSGTICARIYDKSLQVKRQGLDQWYLLWGDRLDPAEPVWRIEIEYLRGVLKELQVFTVEDVIERAAGMWAYGTDQWMRLCVPSKDQTRSRWSTDPAWSQGVQQASLRHDAVPLERLRKAHHLGTVRTLMPVLNGVLSSFGAALNCGTLDDTVAQLFRHVEDYAEFRGVEFDDQLRTKAARL